MIIYYPSTIRLLIAGFVGMLGLSGWGIFLYYSFIVKYSLFTAFLIGIFFVITLFIPLLSVCLILFAITHFGMVIEIRFDGVCFRNLFSTRLFSWENLLLFHTYNGYICKAISLRLFNIGSVIFSDPASKKQKVLWPYAFASYDEMINHIESALISNFFSNIAPHSDQKTFSFGNIHVSREMILLNNKRLYSNLIAQIGMQGSLLVIKCGKDSKVYSLKYVPNLVLLETILQHFGYLLNRH